MAPKFPKTFSEAKARVRKGALPVDVLPDDDMALVRLALTDEKLWHICIQSYWLYQGYLAITPAELLRVAVDKALTTKDYDED